MVAVKLPKGVPSEALTYAIQEACRRFANESRVWRSELAAIDVVADQEEYDLSDSIPDNSEIVRFDSVKVDDGEWPIAHRRLDPGNILHFDENYAPTEASTGGLEVEVIVVPELVDDALPDGICSLWRDGIVAAAVSALAGTENRPYTDPRTAAKYELIFLYEVSQARYANETGGNKAEVFMRPVVF